MSDDTPGPEPVSDAWATACEEDLARERARRGTGPGGDAAAWFGRVADTVAERLGVLGVPVGDLAARTSDALGPVLERNADVITHLGRAGDELVAAFRAAVRAGDGTGHGASGSGAGDGRGQPGRADDQH